MLNSSLTLVWFLWHTDCSNKYLRFCKHDFGGVTVSKGTAFKARIVTEIGLSFQRAMTVQKESSIRGRVRRRLNSTAVEQKPKTIKNSLATGSVLCKNDVRSLD